MGILCCSTMLVNARSWLTRSLCRHFSFRPAFVLGYVACGGGTTSDRPIYYYDPTRRFLRFPALSRRSDRAVLTEPLTLFLAPRSSTSPAQVTARSPTSQTWSSARALRGPGLRAQQQHRQHLRERRCATPPARMHQGSIDSGRSVALSAALVRVSECRRVRCG